MSNHFSAVESVHYQPTDPGRAWVKESEIAIDSSGPLDSDRVFSPNVVKAPGGGYRMYYMGCGPGRPAGRARGYVLSAHSEDGAAWTNEPGIRLDAYGPYADGSVLCPDVIPLPDGRLRMYFSSKRAGLPDVLLSAVSEDGLDWEPEPGVRWSDPDASCAAPRCLYVETGSGSGGRPDLRYRLYFFKYAFPEERGYSFAPGMPSRKNIVTAISDDGLGFEQEQGVRIAQESELESYSVYAPDVVRLGDGTYRMYYAGWTHAPRVTVTSPYNGRIFSATSADGLTWTKAPEICLDIGGRWDGIKASEPCVIDLPDGRSRLFYEACDDRGKWRILSATSR